MILLARWLMIAVLLLLCSCASPTAGSDSTGEPQELTGGVVSFTVGQHRCLMAAFTPPASLVVVRTGPMFFWMSPSPAVRHVYLEDVVNGRLAGTHVLEVNRTGSVDYSYTLSWRV